MTLNLAQVGHSGKFSPTAEVFSQNALYKALKALGWASLDKVHPTDRVSLFQLDGAIIRRDKNQVPGFWIIEVNGQDHPFTGDAADATAEAQRLQEPQPKPLSPARQVALELTTEFPDHADRIARALALVEQGVTQSQYETVWHNNGRDGCYECNCPDSQHRARRSRLGATCKHCWVLEIALRVENERKATAYRKLDDRLQADRARRLATQAGYEAALRPNYINRKAPHYAQLRGIGHR